MDQDHVDDRGIFHRVHMFACGRVYGDGERVIFLRKTIYINYARQTIRAQHCATFCIDHREPLIKWATFITQLRVGGAFVVQWGLTSFYVCYLNCLALESFFANILFGRRNEWNSFMWKRINVRWFHGLVRIYIKYTSFKYWYIHTCDGSWNFLARTQTKNIDDRNHRTACAWIMSFCRGITARSQFTIFVPGYSK